MSGRISDVRRLQSVTSEKKGEMTSDGEEREGPSSMLSWKKYSQVYLSVFIRSKMISGRIDKGIRTFGPNPESEDYRSH